MDWQKGEHADFAIVTGKDLVEYGYDVKRYIVKYGAITDAPANKLNKE